MSCLGNDLTNNAFTVSIEVISFGSNARFVSFLYWRNTKPVIDDKSGRYDVLP